MHKSFTSWLQDAGIEPNADTAPKHWNVIDRYPPTLKEIIAFARLFYSLGNFEDGDLEDFGTALQDADPTFLMRNHRRHLAVLAGAELVAVIERDQSVSAELAALCLVCGGAQGVRTEVPVPEIPRIAARYIESRASKRAVMPATEAEGKVEVDARIRKLERELTIVGEETNMLWWLVSECSRDRNQSWKKIGLPATAIIAGKELADLTRLVPGPVAAPAFLDRVVRLSHSTAPSKTINIKEAIDATPRDWRERLVFRPGPRVEELAAVSYAIKLSLTVSEGNDWSAAFEKGTALDSHSKMLPSALAYQLFLERLLVRVSGDIQES
jgi:hypothetical protein